VRCAGAFSAEKYQSIEPNDTFHGFSRDFCSRAKPNLVPPLVSNFFQVKNVLLRDVFHRPNDRAVAKIIARD